MVLADTQRRVAIASGEFRQDGNFGNGSRLTAAEKVLSICA